MAEMALMNAPSVDEATSNYVNLEWKHEVTNRSDVVLYVVALTLPNYQIGTLNDLLPLTAVGYLPFTYWCVTGGGDDFCTLLYHCVSEACGSNSKCGVRCAFILVKLFYLGRQKSELDYSMYLLPSTSPGLLLKNFH